MIRALGQELIPVLMPMTHAPETGTENRYQKTDGTIFRTQFLRTR